MTWGHRESHRAPRGRGRFITWTSDEGRPILRIEPLGYVVLAAYAGLVLASFLWYDDSRDEPEPTAPADAAGAGSGSPRPVAGAVVPANPDRPEEIPHGEPERVALGPATGSENARIRAIRESVQRAGSPEWPQHAKRLFQTVEHDSSLDVRLTAIRALALAQPALAGPLAIDRLSRGTLDDTEAEAFLVLLGNWGSTEAAQACVIHSHDRSPRVRAAAIQSLHSIRGADAVAEFSRVAWSDPVPAIRLLAIRLLRRLDDPAARRTLAELAAATDDPEIRRAIVE